MIQQQFMPYQNYQQMQQPKPQAGFVVVGTEEEAMRYPIAPGNCITFKVESQPVIIEKTMGFSQFDCPQIRRYRIVEEDMQKREEEPVPAYALKEDIDRIEEEIEKIRTMLPKRPVKKKEEAEDE